MNGNIHVRFGRKISNMLSHLTENGFTIITQKKIHLTKAIAQEFYREHEHRPFFDSLVEFMTSGQVIVQVLEKEDAIKSNRELMGHTNPKEAVINSIRQIYGSNIEYNAVHGSDSEKSAKREINFFFSTIELLDCNHKH